jgi:hypothetical protein
MELRPVTLQAFDQPGADGIPGFDHHNGDCGCGLARRHAGGNGRRDDHVHFERHQFARESRQAIQYASGITRVNLDGLAVDPAQLTQAIQKRLRPLARGVQFRSSRKNSDPPHLAGRLLRARRNGPERYHGETGDELASSHGGSEGHAHKRCRNLALLRTHCQREVTATARTAWGVKSVSW